MGKNMVQELIETKRGDDGCPNCSSGKLIADTDIGEIHCRKCGYVSPEKIEINQDYEDEKHEHSKQTGIKYPYGSSSVIDKSNTDFTGKSVKASMKTTLGRLRLLDARSEIKGNKQRNMSKAVPLIKDWANTLGVPEGATNETIRIYSKAINAKLTRGRSIRSLAAASLQVACKLYDIPRSAQQIADVTGVKPKDLARSYRVLLRLLKEAEPAGNKVTDPVTFLSSISSKLRLQEKTARKAAELIDMSNNKGFSSGKKREVIAAVAVYIACIVDGTGHTQRAIARAANITEVSIRNKYPEMLSALGIRREFVHPNTNLFLTEIRGPSGSAETKTPVKLIKAKTKV